jgi:hypothetical protein
VRVFLRLDLACAVGYFARIKSTHHRIVADLEQMLASAANHLRAKGHVSDELENEVTALRARHLCDLEFTALIHLI